MTLHSASKLLDKLDKVSVETSMPLSSSPSRHHLPCCRGLPSDADKATLSSLMPVEINEKELADSFDDMTQTVEEDTSGSVVESTLEACEFEPPTKRLH